MAKHIAYIGTYAKPDGGVHVLEIDGETGAFRELRVVTGIADPTYLCMNKAKTKVYVGCGKVKIAGAPENDGGVAAF
ncbi:MAG: beta-propeller fold lactonase family protein, partial [Victivallales bacterium]|nr:beta-propeller fold lactonase family protein [Victivallales bacterium]